jgi:predicted lactoylglutathione lyase
MIGYTTLGTNDLDRAIAFYDALLGVVGVKQLAKTERMAMWGEEMGKGMLTVCKPWDGEPATVGNGVMVALNVGTREAVDRLYAKAIELGAADEGAAGERGQGFYGGYFRDLDGNKLCGFCFGG